MERLIVYAYWPWNKNFPQFCKTSKPLKKAIIISSCAAPGIMGRWICETHKQLGMTAQTIGARAVGTLFTGLIAKQQYTSLPTKTHGKLNTLVEKPLS
ncbi:MAG: hypothetical protein ACI9Y1_001107 [Lentisphaeria bacterium]|jgi:hypothetical protein